MTKIQKLPITDYRKVWVTSDIHGYFNLYNELLEKIDLQDNDLLIIAGDSCDRGPQCAQIYDDVMARQERGQNIIHTLGNHEDLLLQAMKDGELWRWYRNGGRETIRSYDNDFGLLEKHKAFIESMPVAIDLGPYFVVHAGIEPDKPLEEQSTYRMTWIRSVFIDNPITCTDKTIVYGHTPNLDGKIHHVGDQKISVDCGSYDTGVVGAIELNSQQKVYVSTDYLNIYKHPYNALKAEKQG